MTGLTIAAQAQALGLPPQTLRGLLFGKDRAGPRVLDQILAFTFQVKAQMGRETPVIIDDIRALVVRLLRPSCRSLADRLRRRVSDDFQSEGELLSFLSVTQDEWRAFVSGEQISPATLQAIARAFRTEVKRLTEQGHRGARWCEDTAALAERLLTFL
jgi:hypothetical protein